MRSLLLLVVLPACIEGEEAPVLSEVVPRACEDNIALDTLFTFSASMDVEVQERVRANPPRFSLDAPGGPIAIDVDVGDFGFLTLTPQQLLPPDADLSLRLDDPAALRSENVFVTTSFPVAYSTRDQARIRNLRATSGNVYIGFTQDLDPATISPSVIFPSAGGPAMYIEAPQNTVYFRVPVADESVTVTIGNGLRTRDGTFVFSEQQTLVLDPEYTLPADPTCYAP